MSGRILKTEQNCTLIARSRFLSFQTISAQNPPLHADRFVLVESWMSFLDQKGIDHLKDPFPRFLIKQATDRSMVQNGF
jgi:hypothetical protein